MIGTFLLTFDSEGKWGWADCLPPRLACYTSPALEQVYAQLLAYLDRYRINATFAFTGAFTMSRAQFDALRPEIEASPLGAAPCTQHALAAADADAGDGWFVPACFAAVQDAGRHEIGSHGFTHIPWRDRDATREVLDSELAFVRKVPGFESRSVRSFIYPRNEVAHTDLLPEHGFTCFRDARPSLGRVANLLRELNVLASSESPALKDEVPVALKPGHFLNWRVGLRRSIPAALTLQRWRHMIRHAARTGGVVHAWTHPENFVDGDAMFPLLEDILRLVADEREAGRLRVVTCSTMAQRAHAAPEAVPARAGGVTSA
jgi:peptidoglycan/xylan/chitin deacetylase (PgdA/CDA1 family)